jgi:hypothetical protein
MRARCERKGKMKTTSLDPLGVMALAALDEAVAGVIERYRRQNRRLAVWQDGKVVRITADEAARVREEHTEYHVGNVEKTGRKATSKCSN